MDHHRTNRGTSSNYQQNIRRKPMKKLSTLLFAFLFVTGITFAQDNTATTTQTGDENEATITQTGNLNQAEILQEGNKTATQTQTGDENIAYIAQTGEGGPGLATQTQLGSYNEATSSTRGKVISEQTQTGDYNYASISGNLTQASQILQSQLGDNNQATFHVAGPGTRHVDITQTQEGNRNESYVTDFRGNPGAPVFTEQFGDDNYIDIMYDGGQKNGFEVTQDGDMNTLNATFGGYNNWLYVDQIGNMNVATTSQSSDGNVGTVSQVGNSNVATINQ
jgi:hypothetical protein